MPHGAHLEVRGHLVGVSYLSTMWVLGIELGSLSVVAAVLTGEAAQWLLNFIFQSYEWSLSLKTL